MVRRVAFVLLVVFAVMGVMQQHLSDGEPHPLRPTPPVLWESANHPVEAPPPPGPCVLAVALHPGGTFTLTSPEAGVAFDLDADGTPERVSWTERGADVAWLAVDRNADGRITSGRELIGDRMTPEARNAPAALQAFANEGPADEQGAFLHAGNSQFQQLVLWTDRNHDGVSDAAELRSARHVLADIRLGFELHQRKDRHGNESRHRTAARLETAARVNAVSVPEDPSRIRWVFDVCLVAR